MYFFFFFFGSAGAKDEHKGIWNLDFNLSHGLTRQTFSF